MSIRMLNIEGQWKVCTTPKGEKYKLVSGLLVKYNLAKAQVKSLLEEQTMLQKKGTDLHIKDLEKLQRAQAIVARLDKTIEQQIKQFDLTYKKVNGNWVYSNKIR